MLTCLIDICTYYYNKLLNNIYYYENENENEIKNDYILMRYSIV